MNSEETLEALLREAASYADELLVGVDDASTDRTLEIATSLADVVYQFRHSAQMAAARMLPFDYATGDWILSLDDDESMDPSFDELLPDLLANDRTTHYWFSRKWIVTLDPCEYLRAAPWFPDWQLRLFRNDRSLVWKPAYSHSGYRVQGQGYCESRASILHFEPVWCSPDKRLEKLARYRLADFGGSAQIAEKLYVISPDTPRRGTVVRPQSDLPMRPGRGVVDRNVRELAPPAFPPWHATIISIDMPASSRSGAGIVAEAIVENTGVLAWTPFLGSWPAIQLGCHILDVNGAILEWDGPRCPVPKLVAPGDSVVFICSFPAPVAPGDYVLEWDMVSESECWFAANGCAVVRTPLVISGGVHPETGSEDPVKG